MKKRLITGILIASLSVLGTNSTFAATPDPAKKAEVDAAKAAKKAEVDAAKAAKKAAADAAKAAKKAAKPAPAPKPAKPAPSPTN